MTSNPEHKILVQIYVALMASVILGVTPSVSVSTVGSILFLIVFIGLLVIKNKKDKDSLTINHIIFLIRTIWISSMFLMIGIIAAAIFADHTIIKDFMNQMTSGVLPTQSAINEVIAEYSKANMGIFFVTLGPSLVYMVYRFGKGMGRAIKGYRLPNAKSWF